MKQNTINARQS